MRIAALKDEAGEFEAIRQAIEDTGHDCHGLGDEQLLLACLRRNACDLLILDLKLPDLDRLRLVKRLRQEFGARLPILSVAASRHEQDMVDALSAGADDFMAKPWRTSELQARVHALLRRSHQHLDESVLNFGPFRWSDINIPRALRAGAGMITPLALGLATGHLEYGIFATLGALPAGFVSFQGASRTRVTAVTFAAFGMAVAGSSSALSITSRRASFAAGGSSALSAMSSAVRTNR